MTEPSLVDTVPLLTVLTHVRNVARECRERSSVDLETILDLGKRAHAALGWFEADQAGKIELARPLLVQAMDGLDPMGTSRRPSPAAPEE